jgi:hypothetical protein
VLIGREVISTGTRNMGIIGTETFGIAFIIGLNNSIIGLVLRMGMSDHRGHHLMENI